MQDWAGNVIAAITAVGGASVGAVVQAHLSTSAAKALARETRRQASRSIRAESLTQTYANIGREFDRVFTAVANMDMGPRAKNAEAMLAEMSPSLNLRDTLREIRAVAQAASLSGWGSEVSHAYSQAFGALLDWQEDVYRRCETCAADPSSSWSPGLVQRGIVAGYIHTFTDLAGRDVAALREE